MTSIHSVTDTSMRQGREETKSVTACTHCGLAVPSGLISHDRVEQFCCSGCETAFELIRAGGLEDYYRFAEKQKRPVKASESLQRHLAYDSDDFLAMFATDLGHQRFRVTLAVSGIHCVACVWLIEKLPQLLPGVIRCHVNWVNATIDLVFHREQVLLSRITSTIERLGYGVHPIRAGMTHSTAVQDNRDQLIRLGIAGAAAGNNMLIATALYLGMFSDLAPAIESLLRYASCGIGLVSLAWPGRVFFRTAWQAFVTRTPHMDLPVALGLGVGGISGLINTLRGSGHIYFDSLSVLVFVLLVGRYFQYRQQMRTADAINLLYRMTPRTARKVVNGEVAEFPVDLLRVEDTIEVLANENFAVDGIIVSGTTTVDESILTGESVPLVKTTGDLVFAASQNLNGSVRVRATATGTDSRIGQIMGLVEESSRQRPKIVEWANAVGGYFVIAVILIAIGTFIYWWPAGPELAAENVVSILIVACPCALALATPLAISVALGRAAQRHILIKGGDVLQRLARPGTLWLDKTGTLTQGRMQLVRWVGDRDYAPHVAAIERQSTHPIALALSNADFLRQFQITESDLPQVNDVEQSSAGGISGSIAGQRLLIGNETYLLRNGLQLSPEKRRVADELTAQGLSPIFIATAETVVATAGVGDPLRPEALAAVTELKQTGWHVGILSGDHPAVVANIAAQLGIDPDRAFGNLLPEDKSRMITENSQRETTVMVGDGVNDSAALAAASVGIAVHGGAEASLQAAAVYLNQSGLDGILRLLTASRRTQNTIRRNFIASLSYNIIAVVLAFCGLINPLIAALLMPLSSLTVVGLSFASPTFSNFRR